ncbi:hypothetical protein H0H87_007374 [Tephrocybe sp. NHM501043]|nr:hypothetical protein H0H87_007374 [Tephrocybe sp. NHM501043]
MPCSQLPDDLIEEIGGYLLHVPDNEFRWNESSFPSPFSENTESYSSILLVSKSWYYALIPSLYRVVILRSKAQARALERTLRGDITLGPKIKRMRVEGGLGPSMEHIIHLAPDIEELWLHLRVWRDDDASGLLLALPKMKNVKRLILHDPDQPPKENASSRKIVDAICSVIVTWKQLVRANFRLTAKQHLDDLPISSNPVRGTPENLQARPLIPHKTSDNFHTFLTQSLSRPRAFHLLRLRDRDYTDLSGTHPYGFLGRTIEMNDLALLAMCGKWSLTVLTGWRIISLPKIKSGINEGEPQSV